MIRFLYELRGCAKTSFRKNEEILARKVLVGVQQGGVFYPTILAFLWAYNFSLVVEAPPTVARY